MRNLFKKLDYRTAKFLKYLFQPRYNFLCIIGAMILYYAAGKSNTLSVLFGMFIYSVGMLTSNNDNIK